jgi:hypothetical protein
MNTRHDQLVEREGPGNDIAGVWQLDCPGITLEWCNKEMYQHEKIIWKIHRPHVAKDLCRWVQFGQIVVEGIVHIKKHDSREWLGKKHLCTWRGRETGESEVQLDDELNSGYIIFSSMHERWGMFECMFGGPWAFTGKKVDTAATLKGEKMMKRKYERYVRDFHEEGFFI